MNVNFFNLRVPYSLNKICKKSLNKYKNKLYKEGCNKKKPMFSGSYRKNFNQKPLRSTEELR